MHSDADWADRKGEEQMRTVLSAGQRAEVGREVVLRGAVVACPGQVYIREPQHAGLRRGDRGVRGAERDRLRQLSHQVHTQGVSGGVCDQASGAEASGQARGGEERAALLVGQLA